MDPPGEMLQWGRDVSVAEIFSQKLRQRCFNGAATFPSRKWLLSVTTFCGKAMLQWGRDVSVAEIDDGDSSELSLVRLQWGRDVSVAEICRCALARRSARRFNGAATFPSRKWDRGREC